MNITGLKNRFARKSIGGLTLIEFAVSSAIFSVLALAMAGMLEVGSASEEGVVTNSGRNRGIRRVQAFLVRELRASSDSKITVGSTPGGNSILTFSYPVQSGGSTGWGIRDKSLGSTSDERNKIGWQVRYTVIPKIENHRINRVLVRQVLDTSLKVRATRILARHLRPGTVTPPGFKVVKTGNVWKVVISTLGDKDGSGRRTATFQVLARN